MGAKSQKTSNDNTMSTSKKAPHRDLFNSSETDMSTPATTSGSKQVRILVINPNSNKPMTKGLDDLVASMSYSPSETVIYTYTASSGPNSINNENDATETTKIVLADFAKNEKLWAYDAFVVACYSQHPLVLSLRKAQPNEKKMKPVIGIFEASISLSLNVSFTSGLYSSSNQPWGQQFGIVTTGKAWVPLLTKGVNEYLGLAHDEEKSLSKAFKGVESTGLNADELHTTPEEEVRRRMVECTTRLVEDRWVGVVILGCAGMAGMDNIVREACVKVLGEEDGEMVQIVDGVKAAIGMADAMLRSE